MFSIKNNRVVIITGVSQGIGLEITKTFLAHGDKVIGCATTPFEQAVDVQVLALQYPEHFVYHSVDITNLEQISTFVAATEKQFGRIDIVISNAGKNVFKGIDCSLEDWQHNLDLNLRSHWHLAKCCRPALTKTKGVIVVITSNHAFYTLRGCAPYNISKRALLSLVQSIQLEWGPDIRAVGIAPGFIDTKGNQAWFDSHQDPEKIRQETINKHPVGRIGQSEEVGDLCLFLSSERAGFIAGTTILMDGGCSAIMQD